MPVCAISVDLDEIHNYLAIHGLKDASVNPHAVYDIAMPRLLRWGEQQGLPLTLFAVGSDLQRANNRQMLATAVQEGHEIGNHSFSHAYDLTRKSRSNIAEDIASATRAIEAATGFTPRGFRAPGYTITEEVYRTLDEQRFLYSSSVFPCFPYYGAKIAAIAAKRLFGKRSSSIVDDPRVLLAPTAPYRVGHPYWTRGVGMLEIPIQTTPWLRLPYFGTALTLLGPKGSAWLSRQVAADGLVNLELHGIDVLGSDDGLAALAPHQYDVRVPWQKKFAALDAAVEALRARGYSFATLAEVAMEFDLTALRGQNPAS